MTTALADAINPLAWTPLAIFRKVRPNAVLLPV
eukprot:CAMPEP_0169187918 /NCGR_PEP_ID=MMETSP1016-20121227/3182_1 /TAXON_ID=342587 /ORGANISM="Karlodinium micrum, Strain CCMP2283" /LENGTH=32 /DNA_ID= /DNA_START= /DNA_END= /DNA_ORIENTATION=